MSKHPFSVGKGHGGNTKLPPIQQMNGKRVDDLVEGLEPGTKAYQLGQCLILVSPPYLDEGWHLSISHPLRYPTWDEIAKARYELIPDNLTMAMILPPSNEYVNIHNRCFHLHEMR